MNDDQSVTTWQAFLEGLWRRMKAVEKDTFAEAVGVSKTSINRWKRGEDWPKAANLERLLAILSEAQRRQFLLLAKADPKVWSLLSADVRASGAEDVFEQGPLSSFQVRHLDHFCLSMLRLQRDTPDRYWQLSEAILQDALVLTETHPVQTGLELSVAKCMPPRADGKVRSLRLEVSMGTAPWRSDLHTEDMFLGAESLAGYAVTRRHGEMVPDVLENSQIPVQVMEHERSAAAFPILRENALAGALIVVCTKPQYFSRQHLALIECYADLIRLAFYDQEFYPYESIDLGLMPPWRRQQPVLATFRQRVQASYRSMLSEDRGMKTLIQVEQHVRQELEQELLQVGRSQEVVVSGD